MYAAHPYLVVGELLQCLLYGLYRALHVCLYYDVQILDVARLYLAEQIVQGYLGHIAYLLRLELVAALLCYLPGQLIYFRNVHYIACGGHLAKAQYLYRLAWPG